MKIGLQDIDWKYVGATLARGDDNDQAAFLKAFVEECASWGTHHQVEMQLAAVNHLLTDNEKDVLAMLSYIGKT
ncbi:hypothetical protein LCGC14_2251240 [marine sediment metagenome]|uniref:Uncharacterized protein n=1 Tax=marine sediment metagenome TaxID=412755 RepID=A0A0F9D2W0_9ZZZZ